MQERLYAELPGVYDALYDQYRDYSLEADFFEEQFRSNRRTDGERVLIVGCGPGRHAAEFVARGYDVLAVDKHPAMAARARRRSGAAAAVGALPDLPVDGIFDLVLLPYNVINYLDAAALPRAIRAVSARVADGGVLILDNEQFPADPGPPSLETWSTAEGTGARLHQLQVTRRRARLDALLIVPGAGVVVDSHDLTVHDDDRVADLLADRGHLVERYEGGYGASMPGDRFTMTVFVAT